MLIQTTPHPLKDLPAISNLGKTYHSDVGMQLARIFVRFEMRATIITSLMSNLHNGKIRDMYQEELSKSSSCGKLPYSESYYFMTERKRLHSSFFLLLYRLALKSGLDHIYCIAAAYAWYLVLAPEEPLAIDRMANLVNQVQSGSGKMHIAACRGCSGNFLLCNTNEKREYASTFHCTACEKKRLRAA